MQAPGRILRHYEEILLLSEQMLEAARAGNWDAMSELQQVYVSEVDQLRRLDHEAGLDQAETARRHHLLERILAHDAAIRNLVSPQLARLGALLDSTRRTRALNHAYGALA